MIHHTEAKKILTRSDIIEALEIMNEEGIDNYTPSKGYDLIYKGNKYPPKEVFRTAVTYKCGEDLDEYLFKGGPPTNRFLQKLNFRIYNKKTGEEEVLATKRNASNKKNKTEKKITRKQLLEDAGAKYVPYSWSAVNEKDKIIIFGTWKDLIKEDKQLILRSDWQWTDKINKNGSRKKAKGYKNALEHIKLIESGEYKLQTYIQERKKSVGPHDKTDIKRILDETLSFKELISKKEYSGDREEITLWYAIDKIETEESKATNSTATIDAEPYEVYEGEKQERIVMDYPRNKTIARKRKKKDHYVCKGCDFYHEDKIVTCHHLEPRATKKETNITLEGLITLCPTCHMIAHDLLKQDYNKYIKRKNLTAKLREIRHR